MQAIDLHVHSSRSDGTFSPSRLVDYAGEKGLTAFALTDHDTVDGLDEAIQYAEKLKQSDHMISEAACSGISEQEFSSSACRNTDSAGCAGQACTANAQNPSATAPAVPEVIPGIEFSTEYLLPEAAERICGLQGQPEPENVPSAYRGRDSGHV